MMGCGFLRLGSTSTRGFLLTPEGLVEGCVIQKIRPACRAGYKLSKYNTSLV